MMKIRVVTHYNEDDPKFLSDYTSIDVYVNGRLVVSYGDSYHDKGQEKVEGLLDGVRAVLGADNVQVTEERVADYAG